jgi:hypothetical protein
MSELIKRTDNNADTYSKLLAGTSVLALTAWVATAGATQAAGDDKPQLWIEIGGQLSRLDNAEEVFAPQLMAGRPSVLGPSQKFEHPPRFSFDGDGKLLFQPKMSDWMFSASVKYGRSTSRKHAHNQTHPAPFVKYYYTSNPSAGSGHISRRPQ